MSEPMNHSQQRLFDLLSDRALFGLTPEEETELKALQLQHPNVHDQEMDRIVAMLEATQPAGGTEPMPNAIKQRILQPSDSPAPATPVDSNTPVETVTSTDTGSRLRRDVLIAIATAATVLVALGLDSLRPTPIYSSGPVSLHEKGGGGVPSAAEQRSSLLQQSTDLVQVKWPATEELPYSGDVVWSDSLQQGYMTFQGLPANDPTVEQYQLWIFDPARDDNPIDGGVFDITSNNAVIKIDAKLKVSSPTLFAITIEKPGGVVVSDRSRLPLLAKVVSEG